MKPISLRTEYLKNPIGIDLTTPCFYWKCDGGKQQTAYRIVVQRHTGSLEGKEILWDSGKVMSAKMTHIKYKGLPLYSRDEVYWQVTLWDEFNDEGESTEAWFEMGLLHVEDWRARWISGNYLPQKSTRYPVDCFRRDFNTNKDIKKARLYISACGVYEAKMNGERIGTACLAPGCTDYRHRIQYQAYDVTDLLDDKNILEIMLADGWYRGSIGCKGVTNVFGRETKLLCQLEITFTDGSKEEIVSDDDFSWSNDGPIRFADLKDGETYDASLLPTYQGKAKEVNEGIIPKSSNNVVATEHETFKAKLIVTPSGKKVLDFGQNIAGFISFRIKGVKGQKVLLRCGEILDQNGEFTQDNIQCSKPVAEIEDREAIINLITDQVEKIPGEKQQTPLQEVIFYCSGSDDEYKMRFGVFGFRYALIETEAYFEPDDFRAIAVYSDMEETGTFNCSHEGINKLYQNTFWSMKGNYLDVPTDCPTRERLGWTADAQIFFNTASYFMNVAPFFRKWLKDLEDDQFPEGNSSAVVPYQGLSMMYDSTGTSVGWNDALIILPYRFWKRYGDQRIIRDYYDMMRKCAMFMINNTGHKDSNDAKENPYNQYVYEKGVQLGEWLEPEEYKENPMDPTITHTEECTAYMHYSMSIMGEVAKVIGNDEDEKIFMKYADGAYRAYQYLFLKEETIDTDRQAKLVRPIALGLAKGKTKENLQKRLKKAIENSNYRVGTGFLSTPFLLTVLTEAGYSELAYKVLENEEKPGWLYEVKSGATTIWEDWEGSVSHNHYSPGSVCEWMINTIAGIMVKGENQFVIKPVPGGSLKYATAEYDSIYGKVTSSWEKSAGGYNFDIVIPSNTKATLLLPNGKEMQIDSGHHTIKCFK